MLPERYKWLAAEPAPKMLIEAIKLLGTKEMPGTKDNPEILEWAEETGLDKKYSADSIPWCGLLMAVVSERAGKLIPKDPLWALNWKNFGVTVFPAMLGDVLVFKRESGGHVAIYVGEDRDCYHILGGNQADAVTITRILKARCVGIRRPVYSIAQPANVRRIFLSASGDISMNEA